MLEISALGGLCLSLDGQPMTQLTTRKVEALLVFLACVPRTHSREMLAEMLWDERSQERAMGNLRVALTSMRKHLKDHVSISRDTVALNSASEFWLDVTQLENSLPGNGELPRNLKELAQVEADVALYRGHFLEGFYVRGARGFENWVVLERERIRSVFEQRIQYLLDALVAYQRWSDAITWAERWISLGLIPEHAYRALMVAHCGQGDMAHVSAAYQRCAQAMIQELGLDPSEKTQVLYEQLLRSGRPPETSFALRDEQQAPSPEVANAALLDWMGQHDVEVLDLPSMAAIYASRGELSIGPRQANVLVRSALHYDVDIQPWLKRVGTTEDAVQALRSSLDGQPRRRVRLRIVEALKGLESQDAAEALAEIALSDSAPEVRSEAALAAASQGRRQEVQAGLLEDLKGTEYEVALPAFVALAEVYGLPRGLGVAPGRSLRRAYVRQRWRSEHGRILRQTGRAALGAGLLLFFHGAAAPLYSYFFSRYFFTESMAEPLAPAWSLAGALGMLVIGGFVGTSLAFTLGLADAIWRCTLKVWQRSLAGALAGLALSLYLILFSLAGLLLPRSSPELYMPVYLVYGLLSGAALAFVIPVLGSRVSPRHQLASALLVGIVLVVLTMPTSYAGYLGDALDVLPDRIVFAILLPLGIGLGLAAWRGGESHSR